MGAPAPREIELASLRAWPALESTALDGWELRFAAGFTKRANSVQPFGPSTGSLAEKVDQCEAWYGAHGAETIFRLTPFSDPELDALLQTRGYRAIDRTAVLHLAAPRVDGHAGVPELHTAELDDWLAIYGALSEMPDGPPPALGAILEACRGERFLGVLADASSAARLACGMAVLDGRLVGLFDLVTDRPQRRRGFGTALIAGLLGWGVGRGATSAYLQVVRTNAPAWSLYEKLGFEHSYDYWYRVGP